MPQTEWTIVLTIEIVTITIFTIELLLKCITYGFLLHDGACFARVANIFDLFVIIVSTIALAASSIDLALIQLARLLRIFRPLRLISRSPSLNTMMRTSLSTTTGFLIFWSGILLVVMAFGVMGVKLFKGRSDRGFCDDPSYLTAATCRGYPSSAGLGRLFTPVHQI